MDTVPRSSFLLSANQVPPTTANMSDWLVLSEWEERSNNNGHLSDIELSQLYDSAVATLDSTEARFQNMNQKSCPTVCGSDTEDFDSDAMLTCDGLSTDEEISPELERSLLEEPSSKETYDVNSYSDKRNSNGHSDSIQINPKLNGNIFETNSESSDDKDFSKDRTVGNSSNELGWSEFLQKSKLKSMQLSHNICSELSEIYKDCNENMVDADFDDDVLSLESPGVKESPEPAADSQKSDLSDSPVEFEKDSNVTSIWDRLSDLTSASRVDLIDQNEPSIQKKHSPSCLMPGNRMPQIFSPLLDFGIPAKFKIKCQVTPENSILKTTFDGDRIGVLSNETVPPQCQDHIGTSVHTSPEVESLPKDKEEGLKRKLQFENDSDSESEERDSQCELKGDSRTTKSDLTYDHEHSTNQTNMKNDDRSMTNNIPIVDPVSLHKNFGKNHELIPEPCLGSKQSTSDCQLSDSQTKMHTSVKKPSKNNFDVKSSKVDNHFRNPNYEATATISGQTVDRQHSAKNCTKILGKELKKSSRSSRKAKQKMKSTVVISVNNISNQKRSITMGNQFEKGDNSSNTQQNKHVPVKNNLNGGNRSVSGKNKSGQNSENSVANKQLADKKSPGRKFGSDWGNLPRKGSEQSGNRPQGVKKKSKKSKKRPKTLHSMLESGYLTAQDLSGIVNIELIPTKLIGTQSSSATPSRNISATAPHGSSHSKNISGTAPHGSSHSKNISGTAPNSSPHSNNISAITPHNSSHSKNISGTAPQGSSHSRNIPEIASSSSTRQEVTHPQDNVNVPAKDPWNGRKFVKAKRVLDKQKQLSTLLEGEDCFDESKINDRVQWVCRRWKVDTLSNQDINLTTAAYTRRQLPTESATFFQGCLEGQKDYTLAIIAPNRKRRLDQDDCSTDANFSTGHAGKRRRLSQDVQLIPDNGGHMQPELFSRQLMEKLALTQNLSLQSLTKQRNDELNALNEQFYYWQCQLQEKHYQEKQYFAYYGYNNGHSSMYELQLDHDYQQKQLDFEMQKQYDYVKTNYALEEKKVRTQYKANIAKVKTVMSEDSSDSDCMTVALRKAPSRINNYKTTYQTVSLTPHVALAMVREDEIYDSFYSHKV